MQESLESLLGHFNSLCVYSRGIKRDKLNGTNGAEFAVFSQIFAFPGKYSTSEAQIFAENCRKPQIFAETGLSHLLGSDFGRTDFSRISIFGPADFFTDFVAGFSPHFCGKKCPEKSSRKIPGEILQNLYNKNPRHISAEGPGQHLVCPF